MESIDIIAYVYPHGTGFVGDTAFQAIEENRRYLAPRFERPRPRTRRSRRERQTTEPLEDQDASPLDYLPCLVLRFSDIPRTQKGLIFGHNPNCDVFLNSDVVSNVHFSLTFDDFSRPIVKDLNSLAGTQVTYDRDGEGTRRDFKWIIGGHEILETPKRIIITVPNAASFQVVVPSHDITSPEYLGKVKSFNQGAAAADVLLDNLGLSYPPTRPDTGANTPGTGEIHLRKKLGEGSFGVVTHLWNVSTGDERVVKEPSSKAIRRGQVDEEAWRREARIMGQVSHPHIVRLISPCFTPHPQLHLEYVPCGSLEDHSALSYHETLTVLSQCLSALSYLHGGKTPIAHRDIKPANILVEYRFDGRIFVKLGDFGMSRDSVELMTICGTALYLAPEIHSEYSNHLSGTARLGYTPAVDIWSLGVVGCELAFGLPRYKDRYRDDGIAWCKKVIRDLQSTLQRKPNDLGQFLIDTMLILSSKTRLSADHCHALVADLSATETGSIQTSSPASYLQEVTRTTLRHPLQQSGAGDLSTIAYQPSSTGVATASYFSRSGAPPPESVPSSSKAVTHYDESGASYQTAAGQFTNVQDGHELAYFLEEYSADPGDPLFVGSSLASQLREDNSEGWASEFLHGSSSHNQNQATDPATNRRADPSGSATPPAGAGGRYRGHGTVPLGESSQLVLDDYDEMAQAAMMLQAIGRGGR